jgi:hypothetical protein
MLHLLDMGDVANISEVYAASIFKPEDGGKVYL